MYGPPELVEISKFEGAEIVILAVNPAPVTIDCTVPLPAEVDANDISALPLEPVATVTKMVAEFTKFNFLAVKIFPV